MLQISHKCTWIFTRCDRRSFHILLISKIYILYHMVHFRYWKTYLIYREIFSSGFMYCRLIVSSSRDYKLPAYSTVFSDVMLILTRWSTREWRFFFLEKSTMKFKFRIFVGTSSFWGCWHSRYAKHSVPCLWGNGESDQHYVKENGQSENN